MGNKDTPIWWIIQINISGNTMKRKPSNKDISLKLPFHFTRHYPRYDFAKLNTAFSYSSITAYNDFAER